MPVTNLRVRGPKQGVTHERVYLDANTRDRIKRLHAYARDVLGINPSMSILIRAGLAELEKHTVIARLFKATDASDTLSIRETALKIELLLAANGDLGVEASRPDTAGAQISDH